MTSEQQKTIVALDVGGANIKLATSAGEAISLPFAMWKHPEQLESQLGALLMRFPESQQIVATMTGELADCFATKRQGVAHIVGALQQAAGSRSLSIYLTDGRLVTSAVARTEHRLAAASNWHSLAAYVGTHESWQNSLLIDIGSTTCDVIPIVDGQVVAEGRTDIERLLSGELIYVGAERTPVVSVVQQLPYRGAMCPVAREFFATTLDVNLIAEQIAERPDDCDTADGKPATRACAVTRLGRCLCVDDEDWTQADAKTATEHLLTIIAGLLLSSLQRVGARHNELSKAPIVVSGHGEFLLEPLLGREVEADRVCLLRDSLDESVSRCAPAYALACLAKRELQ